MSESIIVQALNPENGNLEWVVKEEDYDLKDEIARSTYAGMLHDGERNEKYYEALKLVLNDLKTSGNNAVHTLDIGAGTGILSMMASSAGSTKVTACEVFKPMSDIALKVINKNNLQDCITVVNKKSTELKLTDKADVLVTEIFDTELIGEGVLPTLRDAHQRLLNPGCQVIPSKADVKIQLIESTKLWKMNNFVGHSEQVINFPDQYLNCSGSPAAHEVQIDQLYPDRLTCLSNDILINTFHFDKPFYHKESTVSSYRKTIKIETSGSIHCVLLWWDLTLYEKDNIVLSMQPKWLQNEISNKRTTFWRDHWMQAIYYLGTPLHVKQNDTVHVTMFHDDYSIWFKTEVDQSTQLSIQRPFCKCNLHVIWPRERFAMLNNPEIFNYFVNLSNKFKTKVESVCLVGENSLLPLWYSKLLKKYDIVYIESSEFSKQMTKILCEYSNLNNVKIVQYSKMLSVNSTIVIAEPYFSSSLLPWHHLRIWNIFSSLNRKKDIIFYPSKALLKLCVVYFKDLWKVKAPVTAIEKFDLSCFDDLISSATQPVDVDTFGKFESVEPFSVWEFENTQLSEPTIITEFVFNEPLYKQTKCFNGKINNIENFSKANGVVLWIDFEVDENLYWSTGLDKHLDWVDYSKQGVYFLKSPLTTSVINYDIVFQPDLNELMFRFT